MHCILTACCVSLQYRFDIGILQSVRPWLLARITHPQRCSFTYLKPIHAKIILYYAIKA